MTESRAGAGARAPVVRQGDVRKPIVNSFGVQSMKKMLLALVLGFAALGTAGAQSVSGEWDASMNTPGGPRPFKILFVQEG